MRLDRSVRLDLMMQPEALPSLFAIAEADAPTRSRPVTDWPGWIRVLGQHVAAFRLTVRDRSTAAW